MCIAGRAAAGARIPACAIVRCLAAGFPPGRWLPRFLDFVLQTYNTINTGSLPKHPPQLWQARWKKRARIFSRIAARMRPGLARFVGDVTIPLSSLTVSGLG